MLQLRRHNDILALLKQQGELTVKELCAALYCSPATVRRDLCELEKRGLLRRSFGGAALSEGFFDQQPLSVRGVSHVAEKQRICAAAAQYVHAGDTVFVDASSTSYFLAEYLKDVKDLTVITNNPHLNITLSRLGVLNYCTGGRMLNSSIALVGSEAERYVRGIRADVFFFSARGYCDGVMLDSSKEERDIKIAMLEHSAESYFLCDTSKLGCTYPYAVTDEHGVTAVITELGENTFS